jgi:hypothetical protein
MFFSGIVEAVHAFHARGWGEVTIKVCPSGTLMPCSAGSRFKGYVGTAHSRCGVRGRRDQLAFFTWRRSKAKAVAGASELR